MAFQCVLMDDPVVAADGHTYNREDIENWFKEHNTSPHTNEEFEDKILRPNISMRRQINAWREQHGLPALTFGQPAKAPAHVAGGGDSGGGAGEGAPDMARVLRVLQGLSAPLFSGEPPAGAEESDAEAVEALLRSGTLLSEPGK